MKSILTLLSLTALGAFGYTAYGILNPCSTPIQYSLGTFDTQFGVTKENFQSKILSGASVWEKAFDKNFFEYNRDAKFKINLIYDERQQEIDSKRKTEFGLNQVEAGFKDIDLEYKSAKAVYESHAGTYEASRNNFLQKSKQYEADVNYWNSRDGASPAEYNKLKTTQTELNASANALNKEAANLNKELEQLNDLLDKRNKAAEDYNAVARDYNQKYGHGLEFDQAEYTGEEINVYEFGNSHDLTVALSHELGHALGMDHVENQKSIMFYRTGEQSLTPTPEDLAELKRVCRL